MLIFYINSSSQQKHLQTCRRVFQTLMKISIEELIETADSLIAPVRMGVVRPTAPFAIITGNQNDVSLINKIVFMLQHF